MRSKAERLAGLFFRPIINQRAGAAIDLVNRTPVHQRAHLNAHDIQNLKQLFVTPADYTFGAAAIGATAAFFAYIFTHKDDSQDQENSPVNQMN